MVIRDILCMYRAIDHCKDMKRPESQSKLTIVPIGFDEMKTFVDRHHRHRLPPSGWKFGMAVANDRGEIVGVCSIGRPVARHQDDGWTLEVTRCCTDGTDNASSALYGAAWRATKALGYRRLITYTLLSESGSSLRGSGYRCVGKRRSYTWNSPSRPRVQRYPVEPKLLWEKGGDAE